MPCHCGPSPELHVLFGGAAWNQLTHLEVPRHNDAQWEDHCKGHPHADAMRSGRALREPIGAGGAGAGQRLDGGAEVHSEGLPVGVVVQVVVGVMIGCYHILVRHTSQ